MPIVGNITLFWCTCSINVNSFSNVTSIEITFIIYKNSFKKYSVLDFSLYRPFSKNVLQNMWLNKYYNIIKSQCFFSIGKNDMNQFSFLQNYN